MARIDVSTITVHARITGGAPPFNAAPPGVALQSDDAKLMLGPINHLKEQVEITGVGITRRQRKDANLADTGDFEISGLMDAADPDGLVKALRSAQKAGNELVIRITYSAGVYVEAGWLVENLEIATSVGDFVNVKGSLKASGTFTEMGF